MKKRFTLLALLLTSASFAQTQLATPISTSIAPMLSKVTPTVVNILVKKSIKLPNFLFEQLPAGKKPTVKGIDVGSGVIFNAKQGLIITNDHVVHDEKLMIVTLKNGERYRAKLIGESTGLDLAILQIHAKDLRAIHFGNSAKLRVGDFVAAIGSPYGLTQTVTSGMVSALNRAKPKLEGFQNFIQTDAPINPGNSGGALVNLKGQLVGINTAILSSTDSNDGIGFAIPSNMVKSAIMQLLHYGKFQHGVLGVLVQNLTPTLASALKQKPQHGVLVTKTFPHTAASKAGIQAGDIILSVNGTTIHSANALKDTVGLHHPGSKINISLLRAHKTRKFPVIVGNGKNAGIHDKNLLAGLTLQNFKQLNANGTLTKGVVIENVADTSHALLAGLAAGDVIIAINHHPTPNLNTLLKQIKLNSLFLKIARGTNLFYVELR